MRFQINKTLSYTNGSFTQLGKGLLTQLCRDLQRQQLNRLKQTEHAYVCSLDQLLHLAPGDLVDSDL